MDSKIKTRHQKNGHPKIKEFYFRKRDVHGGVPSLSKARAWVLEGTLRGGVHLCCLRAVGGVAPDGEALRQVQLQGQGRAGGLRVGQEEHLFEVHRLQGGRPQGSAGHPPMGHWRKCASDLPALTPSR